MTTIRSDANAGLVIDSDTSGALTFVTGNSNVALQIDSGGIINLSSSRLILPVGNTTTRANVLGALRFNNESNVFEAYDGSDWNDISVAPPVVPLTVEYLVVAGGGGGGVHTNNYFASGGGGAGGFRSNTILASASSAYSVTVGAGGPGDTDSSLTRGIQGSNSVFYDIVSAGGGGGGSMTPGPSGGIGGAGGSGGGGGGFGQQNPGGPGNSPPVSPPQGNPGGASAGVNTVGGGGGGAGGAGSPAPSPGAGPGGIGENSSITGSVVRYAGGGGGGGYSGGMGGAGGGGNGWGYDGQVATAGQSNTGGGGGGNGFSGGTSGRAGGSGIVILKYPNTFTISNPGAGLTFTTDSANVAGYRITTFTAGTGIIQWS